MTDKHGQNLMNFQPSTGKGMPLTSYIAEDKLTKSGKRLTHCEIILEALRKRNGSTTLELAGYLDGVLTDKQIWKRMNDLVEHKFIRRSDLITLREKDIARGGWSNERNER